MCCVNVTSAGQVTPCGAQPALQPSAPGPRDQALLPAGTGSEEPTAPEQPHGQGQRSRAGAKLLPMATQGALLPLTFSQKY